MKYFFTLISFLFAILTFGQTSSLLWEISGKGLKQPSFLYGTMHVQDSRVFQFGDSVMIKFNQCKIYAGELDMEDINPAEAMKLMMMPKDTTLNMLLSNEDYLFVKKKTSEQLGAMSSIVDRIKPLFTSSLISEMQSKKQDQGVNKDSIDYLDKYLQKLAKRKGMEVVGIETAKEQMAALDKLSLKEQAQMLLKSLQEEEKEGEFIKEMYKYYQDQDLKGIEGLIEKSNMPDLFSESILIKRNYVMVDRITKIIKKAPTFIGIGAAHLPGEEGVIVLLQKKGYKVRPVISKYTGGELK